MTIFSRKNSDSFLIFAQTWIRTDPFRENCLDETVVTRTNNACVRGFSNGTNGIPLSFKVLPMVQMAIPFVPMVMPMVPLAFPMVQLMSMVNQWYHW